jgi:hypothetical protein
MLLVVGGPVRRVVILGVGGPASLPEEGQQRFAVGAVG